MYVATLQCCNTEQPKFNKISFLKNYPDELGKNNGNVNSGQLKSKTDLALNNKFESTTCTYSRTT